MTSTLLKRVERLRHLAILLLSVCAYASAVAQTAATSDEINRITASESLATLTWTNDVNYPWYIVENDPYDGTYLRVSEVPEGTEFTTTLSFTYTSAYESELEFHLYISGSVDIIIDGESRYLNTGSFYVDSEAFRNLPGSHTVNIKYSNGSYSNTVKLKSVKVREYKPLETECLKVGSMPLTFVNDSKNPWICGKGHMQSRLVDPVSRTSKVSTTVTIDKPSSLSFEHEGYANLFKLYVDGAERQANTGGRTCMILNPGTHTVEFEFLYDNDPDNLPYNIDSYYVKISNVCLSQDWTTVAVTSPGNFVTNLVDVLGDRSLLDIEMLKITGSLNDKDWEGISQMKNIVSIDFTGTDITSIPDNAFYDFSTLYTVLLPETLKSIGSMAFYQSGLGEIVIPNSVEQIGQNAFDGCRSLFSVKLPNSLKIIKNATFRNTDIRSIEIPEGLQTIGGSAFGGTFLESVTLPESLESIESYAFEGTQLSSVTIPKNVTSIGYYAFGGIFTLKEVTLNSYANELNSTFGRCSNIESITIPSATPPTIANNGTSDPFSSINKEEVTVFVPEFALGTYKVDSYWFQFRNLKSNEAVSNSDFWAIHGHLKLNSSTTLAGTPSLEIEPGGVLEVASGTPLAIDKFTYSNADGGMAGSPACFLNSSMEVSAKSLVASLKVTYGGRWQFFSPVTDVNMADVTYPSTDSWVIRYYDGARRASEDSDSGNWVNMPADGTLKRGQGYIFQAAAGGTLYMPAAAEQISAFVGTAEAAMTLADNTAASAENTGWNLVGNPYPAYYDIYSMSLQAPITVWDGSSYRAYSLEDDDYVLRPMEAFFVQKSDASMTFAMPRGGIQASATVTRSSAPRTSAADATRQRLNLEITRGDNDEADDYTRIVINEEALISYEGTRDASKFMSHDSDVAQLYSIGDGHALAINERPYANGNAQLGVYIPKSGEEYRISASKAERKAWLHDAVTGIEQDLTAGDYIFTSDEAGTITDRFTIRFAPAEGTSVEGIGTPAVKVAAGKGIITVTAPADAAVAIYSADGSIVATGNGSLDISAAAGVYVVKADGRSFKTIVK